MNTQALANEFLKAYADNANYVYSEIKKECLFIFGDAKSFSLNACTWMDKSSDEMEVWIIDNVVSAMAVEGWYKCKPHTKALNDIIWNACQKEIGEM